VAQALVRIRPLLLRVSASWRSATRAKVAATLLGLTAILVADATPNRPLANLRNWVVDAYERHWPSLRPASRTLVIDIDSNSIRHVGQWPWPRDQLARLVEIAASARVVGIDLLLTETDRLAGSDHGTDAILAANLRRVPGVLAAAADPAGASPPHPVPAATPVFEAGKHPRAALPPHHRSVSWPQATLADAARGTGLITVPPEADGIMRRMATVAWVGSVLIPSFDVEVERLLASVIAIAAMLQFGRIGDKAYTLLCGSAVILLGGGSFGAFATAGLLLDATPPVATLLGTNLVVLAERIHQEVRMRRRTEGELTNALREAELRTEAEIARESLAIALDAAQMGMWDADLIGGTSRRSARHDQIFGYPGPPPEWGRETLLARVTAEDRDAVARSLDAAMKTGALHFQCRIRRQDGSLASIVVDGRVYHSEDGTPTRIAGVVADVTERRRIEEVLQQTQRLQAVGTIAGGVAHNFNNLLAIVLGNLDLASRPSSDIDRVRPYLAAATAAAERGARLTWQLLSFARQQPLRPEPIAPSEQLRNLAILIGETFPANIRIETAIPRDLWGVEIDLGELQLALLNLGFNARDAMPSGGLLRISAKNQAVEDDRLGLAGRYVLIELADTGLGIPREILPRVFEPFMTTKEVGAGSGLGLSQVHGFVHQSGGAVDIESEPVTGTVVRMYLPVANVPTAGTAFTAPEAAYRATGSVLVVEDQPVLADLAAQLFGQWQLEIKVVHQANTALAMLREGQKIDLVFADIMMADGMDGLELAETMKNEFPDIPILLTSGYTDVASDAVTRGFQVIRKPYRMEELGMWLQRLLGIRST